jgi:hypothetical protein
MGARSCSRFGYCVVGTNAHYEYGPPAEALVVRAASGTMGNQPNLKIITMVAKISENRRETGIACLDSFPKSLFGWICRMITT